MLANLVEFFGPVEVEEVELKIPEPTPERKDASIVPEVFHSNSMVVGESRGQLGLVGDTLTPVGSEVYFQDRGGGGLDHPGDFVSGKIA